MLRSECLASEKKRQGYIAGVWGALTGHKMVCFEHMRWGLKEAIEIMVSKHVACHRKNREDVLHCADGLI